MVIAAHVHPVGVEQMTWREFLFGGEEHLPFWFFSGRSIILYLSLVAVTRWMGHRQVGILSGHNYLVAAGIVSVAALRTVHGDSSLVAGLTIVWVYAGINVLLSKLDLRWPFLIDRQPIALVVNGQLQPANLRRARITVEELLTLLRLGNCLKLSEAWSAVLEPTGKLSIVKKRAASPITRKDFGLEPVPVGASVVVVQEGRTEKEALNQLKKDEQWLQDTLRQQHAISDLKQVFLAAAEPDGTLTVVRQGDAMGG